MKGGMVKEGGPSTDNEVSTHEQSFRVMTSYFPALRTLRTEFLPSSQYSVLPIQNTLVLEILDNLYENITLQNDIQVTS